MPVQEGRKAKRVRKMARQIEDQQAIIKVRARATSWRNEAAVLRDLREPTSVLIERARTLESAAQEIEDAIAGRKTG